MKFDNKDSSVRVSKDAVAPFYEYTMPQAMAESYLNFRREHGTKAEKGMPWREYLAYIVNTEFGLRGTCAALVVK